MQTSEGEADQSAEQRNDESDPWRGRRRRWGRNSDDAAQHGRHVGFDSVHHAAVVVDGTRLVAAVARPADAAQRAALAGHDGLSVVGARRKRRWRWRRTRFAQLSSPPSPPPDGHYDEHGPFGGHALVVAHQLVVVTFAAVVDLQSQIGRIRRIRIRHSHRVAIPPPFLSLSIRLVFKFKK